MNGFAGLRVGLIGPLPPPAGGMANQTRQLAELLRAAGATVHLVQSNAPYRPAFVAGLPGLRAAFRLLPYLPALWRAARCSDVFHVMANSGWSWHLFAVPAIWIAHLRRTPVVLNYRGGEAPEFLRRAHAGVRRSMQHVARLAVPSRFLKEAFETYGMHCEVLPNIIDPERFRPAPPRAPAAPPHLLVARNLEAIYDNETALRAFAQVLERLPQARLTLAGSGPEEGRLRALAGRLDVTAQVRFAGRLDRDAMAELYRSADLVLNASLADNMPNSLLEAMASGVAIVSTSVGGIPYLVEDGVNARLVPARAAPAMAAAALELLADDALRARLAGAALREVERYRWTGVAPLLASLYRAAMEASPRTAAARAS